MSQLTIDSISKYFHMNMYEASICLGINRDTLRNTCKNLGIKWPYRKIEAINNRIHSLEKIISLTSDPKIVTKLTGELNKLKISKSKLMKSPNLLLSGLLPMSENNNTMKHRMFPFYIRRVYKNKVPLEKVNEVFNSFKSKETSNYAPMGELKPKEKLILPSITFGDCWLQDFKNIKQTLPPIRRLPFWSPFRKDSAL